jgi:hypothetical protein
MRFDGGSVMRGFGSVLTIVILAGLLIVGLGVMAMAEDPEGLQDEAFESHQRPPSQFDHDLHMDIVEDGDCSKCHHVYEDGKLVEGESSDGESCSECHPVKADKGQTELMPAYHRLCKACHEEQKQGPITCGECHVK